MFFLFFPRVGLHDGGVDSTLSPKCSIEVMSAVALSLVYGLPCSFFFMFYVSFLVYIGILFLRQILLVRSHLAMYRGCRRMYVVRVVFSTMAWKCIVYPLMA